MAFESSEQNMEYYKEQHARQQGNSNGKVPILYLKPGITAVRILPPRVDANGMWLRRFDEHNCKIGEQMIIATCPRQEPFLRDCPICDEGERIYREGEAVQSESEMERGRKLGPKVQYLANVVCYSAPDADTGSLAKGIMVMKFGTKVKQALFDLNMDTEWADIVNLEHGVDLKVVRAGKGLQTTYTVMPQRRSNLRAQLASQHVNLDDFQAPHKLEDVLLPRSFEDLAKLMAGQSRVPGFRPKPTATPVTLTPSGEGFNFPVNQPAVPAPQPSAPAPAPVFPMSQTSDRSPDVVTTSQTIPQVQMVEITYNGQKILVPASAVSQASTMTAPQSQPMPALPDAPPTGGN